VRQRRIVAGHGDLRPEHVCLLAQLVVIDCLEFNREFRILDTVDELGSIWRWNASGCTRHRWAARVYLDLAQKHADAAAS